MAFKVIFAAEVYDDLQISVDWYNEQQSGLGSRFFKAVKGQLARIGKTPYGTAIRYDDVRCAKAKGFPYLIHFMIFPDTNTIKVIAVLSTHRNPETWKLRV